MTASTFPKLGVTNGFWLLALFCAITFFAFSNVRELRSGDETRVAGIAADMQIYGDRLIPRLNGKPFLEYPPLHYWTTSLAFQLLGRTDAAAKIPAAAAAAASVLVLYFFALNLGYPVWAAILSGVMLATSAQFFDNGGKAMVDSGLAFFILFAVFAMYGMNTAISWRKRLLFWCGAAIAMCGGIMTKGMLGLLIPGLVGGVWLLLDEFRNRRFSFGKWLLLAASGVAGATGAALWYYMLYRNAGAEMFHTAFFVNNIGRFSGSQGDHTENIFYYFIKLPSLFWPWLPLLPFAIWHEAKNWKRTGEAGRLIALVFLLSPFAALSLASSKRVVYLLMLYAPAALLCGRLLYELPPKATDLLARIYEKLPKWMHRQWRLPALAVAAIALGLLMSAINVGRGLIMNKKESLRPLFEECARLERSGKVITLCDAPERTSGAAVFYLGHRVKELRSPLPPPEINEYRVFRDKQLTGTQYADHHHLTAQETQIR